MMRAHPSRRRHAAVVALALSFLASSVVGSSVVPAAAATPGTVSIVATGGAPLGTGWTHDPTTGVLSVGSDVSIDASALVSLLDAGHLTVVARSITVSADVVATAGDHDLILKSEQDIVVAPGVRLETRGGDIVLWADSSGDLTDPTRAGGGIQLGRDPDRATDVNCPAAATTQVQLVTDGGDIVLSGGAVADVAALRSSGFASYRSGGSFPRACSEYYYAIGVFAATLDAGVSTGAGGGSIVIRGNSLDFTGMIWTVQLGGVYGASTSLRTTGAGTIDVLGDASAAGNANTGAACGSSHPSRNPWGVAMTGRITSEDGAITLTGISTVRRPGPRGHSISGVAESASGTITIIDATDPVSPPVTICSGTTATDSNGPFINAAKLGKGDLAASSSDVLVIADRFAFANNARIETTGTFTLRPRGASFLDALTYPVANLVSTSIGALTLGRAGNLSTVTIGSAVPTIPGPVEIHGSSIAFGGTLSTDDTLSLFATVAATQTAAITATDLRLSGPGQFTLAAAGNALGSVAGGTSAARLGSLTLVDGSGGLRVGVADGLGVAAVGPIDIATVVDDLTVAADIDTDDTTTGAIVLNAGRSKPIGDATGGDILISGSPSLRAGTGGVVRLFSGSDEASTGLTLLVGGAGNARSGVDETTVVFEPPLAAGGSYALFRSSDPVEEEPEEEEPGEEEEPEEEEPGEEEVAGGGSPAAGGSLRLSCTPSPVVPLGTITCSVTGGAPDIDILWSAASDGRSFAGQGVLLGPDGTGSFEFVAPAAAAGLLIDVVLVGWGVDVAVPVGIGSLAPLRVNAGLGPRSDVPREFPLQVLLIAALPTLLLVPRSRMR